MTEQSLEYDEPRTFTVQVSETTIHWNLGEPSPGSNCRSMTYLDSETKVIEVETTVRSRVVTTPGKEADRG